MKRYSNQRKAVIIVLFCASIFSVISFIRSFVAYSRNLSFYEEEKDRYLQTINTRQKLQGDIAKATSEAALEERIRNELGLLKAGETSVIVPLPTVTLTPSPTPKFLEKVDAIMRSLW